MVSRFTTSTILALIILSFSTGGLGVAHRDEARTAIGPVNSPLTAVNGPQRTIVISVQFPDKGNSTSPTQILTMLSNLNNYYAEDSYRTVSFQTGSTPAASSPWYTLPNPMTYYGANTVSSANQLVSDSLQAAYNAGVDLANYKFAIVVHSGDDQAKTRAPSDIHSYTIPGFVFNPAPLISYKISTSVVAESDPTGVYCHEAGHLLGLPDLYDLTGQIDPTNNFLGYWEIMALGEWNPNPGPPPPGTYPSHHSIWSKIQLGFVPSSRIAIVQPGQGFTAVTIQFREFGVKLKFTPVIMPNNNIHLQVVPEVSQLDFTNALTISGFTVPALSTRRAQTEFELQDGQSFVIAGLMDNRVTDQYSKMPGLGDIPILGNLFRSKNAQKSATELVVLCTVHRISASTEPAPTPKYPQPFMDKGKFDGPSATGGGK